MDNYTIFTIEIIPFILHETMLFVLDKSTEKMGLQYQRNLHYLTEVQWDISDLPYIRNKDHYQY